MVSSLDHAFIITTVLFLKIELCICACARAEYEINGECCPMCPSGQGLRVKTACTQTSDTVCEPLEGFYCTDGYRGGCRYAVEHRKCSPGQYIKQKGTALTDTECAACADGTFSNGSLEMCKPHSECEDLGLIEIKPGTNSLDAECGKKPPVALIAGVIAGVLTVLAALFFVIRYRCPHRADSAEKKGDTHQRDTRKGLPTPRGEDRMAMCALNHPGHVASPAENDCEIQPCDPQENEFTPKVDETIDAIRENFLFCKQLPEKNNRRGNFSGHVRIF
ncbi:tumor necrosis factor receptor superfamily member 5-like isoform X2 [Hemibagrus wyckioides]|uniref:tumor necrosis factor receptor superfamily member 5-like isoform X2 n=1 Tax=Hemibagrus wyckioides TaxID=337641 RepID=UPI00266DA05D|nr:tumor necrosis factor receptor superfamily member 5-like isoform X2 [Hemibagrus wyckioides]